MTIADGWYPDPVEGNRLRYWSQGAWTAHTRDRAGAVGPDSSDIATAAADAPASPPAPATAPHAPGATFSPPPTQGVFAAPRGLYGPPQPAAPRRYTGVIIGAVVGLLVVAMVVSGVVTFIAQQNREAEAEAEAATSTTPSPSATASEEPEFAIDEVQRPLTRPADYAVPEGFVEYSNETLGITYGIPADWVDITADYAQYYDLGAEDDTAAEIVEYVGAWTSSGTAEYGPDDVVITHSALTESTSPTLYNVSLLRYISIGSDGVDWEESEPYVTDLGIPVIKTVGVPADTTYFVQEYIWVVGGGDTIAIVSCAVYGVGHQCDAVDEIVNSIWLEP